MSESKNNNELMLEVNERLKEWNLLAKTWQRRNILLSLLAIVTASAIATFTSVEYVSEFTLKWITFCNVVVVAAIPLFDMKSRTVNYRNAWRHLNVYRLKRVTNECSDKELISAYQQAEEIIDHFDVSDKGNQPSNSKKA